MDRLGPIDRSRVLARFGSAEAREGFLPTLQQACAILEMRAKHRLEVVFGVAPVADLDGVLLVDEDFPVGSLPALALDSAYSLDELLLALEEFLAPVQAGRERRQALRRKALLAEARATLSPTELAAFWDAVDTWNWPEQHQELVLLRGMRVTRANQTLAHTGFLRDSLSGRFAWLRLWEEACARREG